MEAVATEAPVETTDTAEQAPATEVDQQEYANDAFKDYFVDPKEPTEPQGKDPKAAGKEPQAQQPKDQNNQGQDPKQGAKEAAPTEKPDPFESAFVKDGVFDIDGVMGISLDGLSFKSEEAQPVQRPNEPEKSDIPAWKQEYEAEKVFRENITAMTAGPVENVYNQIGQLDIPPEYKEPILNILRQEYSRIAADNENRFREREAQNKYRKQSEEMDRFKEEARSSKIPELARTNASAVINKMPGNDQASKVDLYNRIMFGPNAGGELLEDMFIAAHPNHAKMSQGELDKAKLRFVNELQADGKRLQRHFDRAYAYLLTRPDNMKRLLGHVSQKTDAAARSNSLAAQKTPAGTVARKQQSSDPWGSYFADPEGARLRI